MCDTGHAPHVAGVLFFPTYEKGIDGGVGYHDRGERDGKELGICGIRAGGGRGGAALIEHINLVGGGVVDHLSRDGLQGMINMWHSHLEVVGVGHLEADGVADLCGACADVQNRAVSMGGNHTCVILLSRDTTLPLVWNVVGKYDRPRVDAAVTAASVAQSSAVRDSRVAPCAPAASRKRIAVNRVARRNMVMSIDLTGSTTSWGRVTLCTMLL